MTTDINEQIQRLALNIATAEKEIAERKKLWLDWRNGNGSPVFTDDNQGDDPYIAERKALLAGWAEELATIRAAQKIYTSHKLGQPGQPGRPRKNQSAMVSLIKAMLSSGKAWKDFHSDLDAEFGSHRLSYYQQVYYRKKR